MNDTSKCGALFGKTRQAVLALLYGQPGSAFYTSQITEAVNKGRGAVQRELKTLTASGIITREARGNQVFYQANPQSPIFSELESMVGKIAKPKAETTASRAERNIHVPKKKINESCCRHHIRKLAFFGSVLRDDFSPQSDVDVLVEFEPEHTPGLNFFNMQNELSRLLKRQVDLRTAPELSRRFRQQVLNEAELLYSNSVISGYVE